MTNPSSSRRELSSSRTTRVVTSSSSSSSSTAGGVGIGVGGSSSLSTSIGVSSGGALGVGLGLTPRARPGMSPGGAPMHINRIREKRDLQDLNNRLEYYVRFQRDKESRIRQLQEALEQARLEYQEKLAQKEAQFADRVRLWRAEKERLVLQSAELQNQLEVANRERQEADARLSQKQLQVTELEQLNEQLNGDRMGLQKRVAELEAELARQRNQYNRLMKDNTAVDGEVRGYKQQISSYVAQLAKARQQISSLQEDLDRVGGDKERTITTLRTEVTELKEARLELEERLKIDFQTKLDEFNRLREQQYEDNKRRWMEVFKDEYNRKIQAYKEKNAELSHNLAQLEADRDRHSVELEQLRVDKERWMSIRESVERENKRLKEELDRALALKQRELDKKNIELRDLKERYQRLERQFDDLIAVKISLTEEIEQFRKILGDEESRLQYQSPGRTKKRRLSMDGDYLTTPGRATGGASGSSSFTSSYSRTTTTGATSGSTPASSSSWSLGVGTGSGSAGSALGGGSSWRYSSSRTTGASPAVGETSYSSYSSSSSSRVVGGSPLVGGSTSVRSSGLSISGGSGFSASVGSGTASGPLTFSTVDLEAGHIDILNESDKPVKLDGWQITNQDRSKTFPLPEGRILKQHSKIRVVIGANANAAPGEVWWRADPWTGENVEKALLVDPAGRQVSHINMIPEYLSAEVRNKRCHVM